MRSVVAGLMASALALAAACATSPAGGGAAEREAQAFLDGALQAAWREHGFPAAAATVLTSRDIRVAAVGRRRVDRPDQVTLDDQYGLGSNTKAVTATMLAALVERGLLRWDTTLGEALPEVAMRPEYRQVTLRQLLTHRAGLRPYTTREAHEHAAALAAADPAGAKLAFAREVLAEEPAYLPGGETRYSNADFSLAALLAERATGKSWRELVTAHVCRPLELACVFGAPAASDPFKPWGHSREGEVLTPIEPVARASAMQGAGGLSLSIGDYAKFLQAHLRGLRGEDTRLLPASAVRELHRPDGRYALGWGIQEYAGARSSVHAGGNGQFYALMAIQPARDIAVAFLTNDGGDEVEAHASAFLKVLLAGPP